MKKKLFKSIKTRLAFWFLVVALLPLIIFTMVVYHQRAESIKEIEFEKLLAIRDLKIEQVNTWLDERIGDLKAISEDYLLRDLVESTFKKEKLTQNDTESRSKVRDILYRYAENYKSYEKLFIIDPVSEKIEISTNTVFEGMDRSGHTYLIEPMRTRELYIRGIYYSTLMGKPGMTFSIPIFSNTNPAKRIIGVLVARIDLEQSLYNLLQDRTAMGKTGETLIVNKDRMALNELRWYNRAPLRLKLDSKAALLASQGKTGIIEATDYRGEKALVAYGYIPRTQWGFEAKQDLKEIYGPIRKMLSEFLVFFIFSGIAVYVCAIFWSKKMARPILEMTRVSKMIQEGDLSARNQGFNGDELGFLARSFNTMADSLMAQIEIQKTGTDINETMVAASKLEDFRKDLLKKLVDATDSDFGAYYLLNRKSNMFEHFSSIGLNPELLEPFDAAILEGSFGKPLTTKKISHIKEIPEDSVFKFKTFTGTILPKEIIMVPVVIDGRVLAVMCLANINNYSEKSLAILNRVWLGINTAFSNLLANEVTKKLAVELNSKNMELEAQTGELQAQKDELEQQNVELEIQKRQIEEANRLKSEFLSNMSHELRTPLNSIMALSRVLIMQASQKLSEEEGNYLEIIERNGKNLLALINDILDLSKIEAGRMDVSPKPFSITSCVEMIIDSLEPIAGNKGIVLNKNFPDKFPLVESDELRTHQILQNIIGNAVKFTEQGSVTISACSDAEKVYIDVADTGIGISEKYLSYIFEEFRQVDGSTSRRYEGTGLGLTIAYKAARMLGGDISVKSIPGKGSTFTLTLPIGWQGTPSVHEPLLMKPVPEIKPAQKTILVVDDDPDIVAMIADNFISEGYNAIRATSGKEAIRLAQTHRPFAITLDIVMPDMDGWEVLQKLKEDPDTKDIPVIIVSVSDDKDTGFALGAMGYVSKPVEKDALISEIYKVGQPLMHSIMVVDDSEIERREIARIVEEEGLKAVVADNGSQCIELIKKDPPDVLILDLMMPEMDGFDVVNSIRSDPETSHLPVIVVTAKDLTDEDRKKLSGNVSSVLEKSVATPTMVLENIKNILGDIEVYPKTHKLKETQKVKEKQETTHRILLVEDNESAIIQVKTVLENQGYAIDIARGGQEAIDYVKHTIPDGIVLDLMMPEIDGFEVLERIRGTKATAKIPVLILTAKDLTPDDFAKLSANNIQQLIQKGDIDQQGLSFKVQLMLGAEPKSQVKPLVESEKKEEPEKVGDQQEKNAQPAIKKQIGTKGTRKAKPIQGRPTILVVEDNPDNMITIKAVLQNKYHILEAIDGEEGLKTTLAEQPDLVLLDMALPKMDGMTVAKKIKEDKICNEIPIIALTAHAMKGDREKIIAAGCDDYIPKPIDPEGILKKIEDWIKI